MKSYMSHLQQYTKIIQMPTLQTYFSEILSKLKCRCHLVSSICNCKAGNLHPQSLKIQYCYLLNDNDKLFTLKKVISMAIIIQWLPSVKPKLL